MFHVEQLKKNDMTIEEVKKEIRDVNDFPIKGIVFKDLTTAFKNPDCMRFFEDEMYRLYKDCGITKVIGIESRGFIMAPVLGNRLGVGFVPIRKKGKLPAETIEISYAKEYGVDIIQLHKDALTPDDVVLIHDDLLATGGTMKAACDLVRKFGVKKIYVNFLVELDALKGREKFDSDVKVDSLIHY
jgi:adenine phosphoribosyltransferase